MINPPPKDTTLAKSRYSLVVAVSKRARQIVSRREPLEPGRKPVSRALEEITNGKVRVILREPAKGEDSQE